jgi:hypothetical protein
MGCLRLAFPENPGLQRYEEQPGPVCNAPLRRSCGTTGRKYLVKAEPEPAVHPSGRFRKDLIPSQLRQERVGNRPGDIVVDRSVACSASVRGMLAGYVEVA